MSQQIPARTDPSESAGEGYSVPVLDFSGPKDHDPVPFRAADVHWALLVSAGMAVLIADTVFLFTGIPRTVLVGLCCFTVVMHSAEAIAMLAVLTKCVKRPSSASTRALYVVQTVAFGFPSFISLRKALAEHLD